MKIGHPEIIVFLSTVHPVGVSVLERRDPRRVVVHRDSESRRKLSNRAKITVKVK